MKTRLRPREWMITLIVLGLSACGIGAPPDVLVSRSGTSTCSMTGIDTAEVRPAVPAGPLFVGPRGQYSMVTGLIWDPVQLSGDQAWRVVPGTEAVVMVGAVEPDEPTTVEVQLERRAMELASLGAGVSVERVTVLCGSGLGLTEFTAVGRARVVEVVAVSGEVVAVARFSAPPETFAETIASVEPYLLSLRVDCGPQSGC